MSRKVTKKTKKKMSLARLRFLSESPEARQVLINRIVSVNKQGFLGRHHTQESKDAISKKRLGRKLTAAIDLSHKFKRHLSVF